MKDRQSWGRNSVILVTLCLAGWGPLVVSSVCFAASPEVIRVDAGTVVGPLPHLWNGIMGDLSLTLIPQGKRLLDRVAATSEKAYYRRTMGMLNSGIGFPSSSNLYHESESGEVYYDFVLFDQLFDAIVDSRMVPFLCLSFMPEALSAAPDQSERQPWEYPDRYPPKDYERWQDLIRELALHVVERYGRDQVLQWKWELWNEPDLTFYWHGTDEEYFKLYDFTVSAIKSVLPEAQVGGNALAGPDSKRGRPFLRGFLEHCVSGVNYSTGSRGTSLDFITFHMKGGGSSKQGNLTSPALLEGAKIEPRHPGFTGMLARTREVLKAISDVEGTSGIPVYITECDIDFGVGSSIYEDPNAIYRNTEYFPTFQCALLAEMLSLRDEYPDNPIAGLTMDTLFFAGRRVFEGQRTLFTAAGIEKPVFNSLRLVSKLGDQQLALEGSIASSLGGLASRKSDGTLQVMLFNFREDTEYSEMVDVELRIRGAKAPAYRVRHFRIDANHSNAHSVWRDMGAPILPSAAQLIEIRKNASLQAFEPVHKVKVRGGEIVLGRSFPPHSVSLFLFVPEGN